MIAVFLVYSAAIGQVQQIKIYVSLLVFALISTCIGYNAYGKATIIGDNGTETITTDDAENVFYHVTSKEGASQIVKTGELMGKERMSKMKINELKLTDVSGGFECDLFNYGKMRESLGCFNYKFTPGVYGVRTEFGKGGWALTEILAGKYSDFSGTIQADGQILTATQLKRYTCYVGADLNWDIKLGFRKKTIHNQIKYAINNGLGFGKSIDELKKMFELSEGRFERSFEQTSGERWRISMAVGYAYEKSIYCFPWVNSHFLKNLSCLEL